MTPVKKCTDLFAFKCIENAYIMVQSNASVSCDDITPDYRCY